MMSKHQQGILAAIATGLVWSVLSLALKSALVFADPATISWVRLFLGAVFLFLYFSFKNIRFYEEIPRFSWLVIPAGIGLAGNFLGFVFGIGKTGAGHATLLIQLGTLLLSISSLWFFKEKLKPIQKWGILLAFIGFACFHFFQSQSALQNGILSDFKIGDLALATGAITWTLWALLHKKMNLMGFHPQKINTFVFFIASLALLPFAQPLSLLNLDFQQWSLILFLSMNSIIGYGCLAFAMENAPVYQVSLIVALYPLLTLIYTKNSEPLPTMGIISALLIVLGVVLSTRKK